MWGRTHLASKTYYLFFLKPSKFTQLVKQQTSFLHLKSSGGEKNEWKKARKEGGGKKRQEKMEGLS